MKKKQNKTTKKIECETKKSPFSQTFMKETAKKPLEEKKAKKIKKNKAFQNNEMQSRLPMLSNRVKITVEGFNQNRLIDALLKEGIRIYGLKRHSQKLMEVVIDYKMRQKAIALIQKMCYTYSVTGVSGVMPISKWLIARIGLLVGTIVFAIIAAISGRFIWKIDISGNEKVDSLTIMRQLADVNVSVGKTKHFDSFEVSLVVGEIEGIAECTVEVVGTTVRVSVIESKDYIKPDNDATVGDLISLYDAEITRVVVSGGTGKVGIGDRVPKGEILISKDVLDTNGEVIRETKARGSVYGKVYFSDSTIISTATQEIVRTGKEKRKTVLGLYGLKAGRKPSCDYAEFETEYKKSYAFRNTFLPIIMEQTTYYEVEKKIVVRPIEELIEEYKRDKLLSIIINAGGSEIKTTVVKQELSNGLFSVQLYMEAEMLISEFKESPPTLTNEQQTLKALSFS